MNPKVSIIITNFRHDAYLPFAVMSVLNQTFKDWELIIANDNPDSKTPYYDRIDKRILVMDAKKNIGQPARINFCIPWLRGEFTAFLDADDYWLPWKLNYQLGFDFDMTYGDCLVKQADGKTRLVHTKPWDRDMVLHKQCLTTFSSIIVKTELLKRCPFPEDIGNGNDRVWTLDLSLLTDNILYTPLPLFVYRDYTSQFRKQFNFNPITKFNTLLKRVERRKKNKVLQDYINRRYDVK